MKIYLDMCAIQRPLDTPGQVRVAREAKAVLDMLSLCEAGSIDLMTSEALIYENEQNPTPIRREYGRVVLAQAKATIRMTSGVKKRSAQLLSYG